MRTRAPHTVNSAPSAKTPAHLRIRGHLLDRIRELPPNARLPTEVVLAGEFGVSRLTVHKVMARLQQEGLVVRRGKGGTFVAREAHRVQREGFQGRNGTLAIAYPNWFSYDFWLKVDIAERLALQHGMRPETIKLNPDTPVERIVAFARSIQARGLLLLAPGGTVEKRAVQVLMRLGCPCVLLEPSAYVRRGAPVWAVAPDYRRIGRMQVETLAGKGHRRIGYVREEPYSLAGELQIDGMRAALRRLRLPSAALTVARERTRPWDDSSLVGYTRTRTLLGGRQPPTALVYDAQAGAHAGLRAVHELGLTVPGDISILVSAPAHPYARYDWPRLGGVFAPPAALVERAVAVLRAPEPGVRIWIAPVVEPRESVSAPPS